MSILPNFHFQYSSVPDPAERPSRFFNILPYRESNLSDEHYEAGHAGVAELSRLGSKDGAGSLNQPAMSKQDNLLKWGMPELSPEDVRLLAPFLDLLLRLDDAIDIFDHTTQEDILDDAMLSVLSFWKMGTTPSSHSGANSKLVEALLSPVINGRPELKDPFLKALMAAVSAQQVGPDNEMTFEKFKKVRMASSSVKAGFDVGIVFQGHDISDEEEHSVSQLLEYGYLSTALSNDYYGFDKEYHDHMATGTINHMHNSIAFLMRNYGYDEDEAKDIVKAEVLAAEKKLLDGYGEWKRSPEPKSENLCAYMELFILTIGGGNYWHAKSQRYPVDEAAQSKGARTGLIRKPGKTLLKLEGYPPPASVGFSEHSSIDGNSSNRNIRSATTYDILAPFQRIGTVESCTNPYTYTKSLPGKNTLGKFLQSLTPWFHISDNSLSVINEIMTMLFTASLMLDDIEDGSHLRRGLPAAHVKYGLSQTVNSTTYLFGRATMLVCQNLRSECLNVTINELENLALGQSMDLNWTFHKTCPTVGEYLVMIDHKTGGFFRLASQLMQTDAGVECNDNLVHLITLMGRYYQIRDDYQNLASEEYSAKKGFCDDLSEGKFSFPLIHLLQHSSNAAVLRRLPIFGKDGQRGEVSEETKLYILDEMKKTGSLEHTLDVLHQLFESMLATLDTVEADMGTNKKLRCLILLLKL